MKLPRRRVSCQHSHLSGCLQEIHTSVASLQAAKQQERHKRSREIREAKEAPPVYMYELRAMNQKVRATPCCRLCETACLCCHNFSRRLRWMGLVAEQRDGSYADCTKKHHYCTDGL